MGSLFQKYWAEGNLFSDVTKCNQFQKQPSLGGVLPSCFSLKSFGGSILKLEYGNQNVDGQTDAPTTTNFESNLAQVVSY